jgi:hypothetical protein
MPFNEELLYFALLNFGYYHCRKEYFAFMTINKKVYAFLQPYLQTIA